MKTSSKGFSLIELLIVILIIGILAAVALPYYKGHIIRARLTEVQNAMTVVRTAVTTYHQDTEGAWPDCLTITEINNSLGVGLRSISRVSHMEIVNGVITAKVDNIDPLVDDKTLSLTPVVNGDGSIRWIWGWSPDFPVHLRPKGS